jgi:DNA-binding NtrC family response regulator
MYTIENNSNVGFIATNHMLSLPNASVRSVAPVKLSLRKIVREMRASEVSYQNAVREFQERYIVGVLIAHTCHLGRIAEELGMHRNALARTICGLRIDVKQIGNILRLRP